MEILVNWDDVFLEAERAGIAWEATIYTIVPFKGYTPQLYGTRVLTREARANGSYPTEHGCFTSHEEADEEMKRFYSTQRLFYVSPENFEQLVSNKEK